VLTQTLKNQLNTQGVFLQINQVHHEVIHVDDKPSFSKVIHEDMVHKYLNGRQKIALAKEHQCWFIKSIGSSESGLPLIGLLDPIIVVPPVDVQLGEALIMLQHIDKDGDARKGISVFEGMGVDITMVLAGPEYTILLRNKEEGQSLWELKRNNFSFLQISSMNVLKASISCGLSK